MKPLSLALIRGRYAQDGGAEQFIARTLTALISKKVQVTLVTRQWHQGNGYKTLTCNPFYLGRVWRDYTFARCVCRLLARKQFDLVQSHERIACCDIYRAGDGVHREWLKQRRRNLGRLQRLGIQLNPYHYYMKQAEKALFLNPRLRAVICNSRMVKQEIKDYFGLAEEKLHVIYSGVDVNTFHPRIKSHRKPLRARYHIPQDATVFVFVGSGFERKGLASVLTALAELPAGSYLLVVGRDKQFRKYFRLSRSLGVANRVHFIGSQADVRPFYGAADALVLPTLYDPFPNVVLEAMASGLAVITSIKSGASEVIKNGINGYTCDALDNESLTLYMRELLSEQTQVALGKAARETVEPMSIERMGEDLLMLYGQLLQPTT